MRRRRVDRIRWLPALVLACVLGSLLTGFVVGYGAVWFQLFGEQPDREDYQVSAGGYACAALVVGLGLAALRRLGVAPWVTVTAAFGAALLAVLALGSWSTATSLPYESPQLGHWQDGAGGVLSCPWAWPPVVLGVLALTGRGPARTRQ